VPDNTCQCRADQSLCLVDSGNVKRSDKSVLWRVYHVNSVLIHIIVYIMRHVHIVTVSDASTQSCMHNSYAYNNLAPGL